MIKVGLARNEKEIIQCLDIRTKVFGEEQGIRRGQDFDGQDDMAKHILLHYNLQPIGCARIRILGGKAKLERIAILKKFRGRGFGNPLIDYLRMYSKRQKVKSIYFDAQAYLQKFYEKFGFKVVGKPFKEVGIKHIKMEIKL